MPLFCEICFRGLMQGIYLLLPAIPGPATASMVNRRAIDKRERWFCV